MPHEANELLDTDFEGDENLGLHDLTSDEAQGIAERRTQELVEAQRGYVQKVSLPTTHNID